MTMMIMVMMTRKITMMIKNMMMITMMMKTMMMAMTMMYPVSVSVYYSDTCNLKFALLAHK